MATDIKIPAVGESITEGTILSWLVATGEAVAVDQPILELETDKVTAEIPSPVAGVLTEQLFGEGDDVEIGAVVARVDEGATAAAGAAEKTYESASALGSTAAAGAADGSDASADIPPLSPAVRRMLGEHGLSASGIQGSGKAGRILKSDILDFLKVHEGDAPGELDSIPPDVLDLGIDDGAMADVGTDTAPRSSMTAVMPDLDEATDSSVPTSSGRRSRRVKMTRMRRAIARRLKEVQNTAAILTTFNEVDMSEVMALRSRYKEPFQKRHGVKLGFMSFFIKASIEALKDYPAVNGSIDGDEQIFNDFYDIGVAVSSETGLVVPVIRDADRLSFAEVEKTIGDLAGKARSGNLTLEQLTGGTFSITNGGIFGSMLSTPILNPPQSAILGMHNIVRRPVAIGDEVIIRPVMYLALSYDHRIVDGSQAVGFLVKIKQLLEDPARLLLET
jgi:2-oxoglutarate dehydrogenase E2 component (dihydrolipoamide succinyltransferase)